MLGYLSFWEIEKGKRNFSNDKLARFMYHIDRGSNTPMTKL